MKKMYKSRNEENLLPFHIIKAASEGDVSAINTVLKHYEGYIIKLSTRKLLEFPYFYPHSPAFTGSAINNFQKMPKHKESYSFLM